MVLFLFRFYVLICSSENNDIKNILTKTETKNVKEMKDRNRKMEKINRKFMKNRRRMIRLEFFESAEKIRRK